MKDGIRIVYPFHSKINVKLFDYPSFGQNRISIFGTFPGSDGWPSGGINKPPLAPSIKCVLIAMAAFFPPETGPSFTSSFSFGSNPRVCFFFFGHLYSC